MEAARALPERASLVPLGSAALGWLFLAEGEKHRPSFWQSHLSEPIMPTALEVHSLLLNICGIIFEADVKVM